ncbi:efflux RND transporter periplasmic adaptor subunit [Inhella proteolytica]|uniref:Efflux RND transporter periplasmic adaptor subunit n=1 Tax=Inhella proteolytica TaxID=2795029 RepID=A0A931J2S1_9BURK|nr:efflux RND transporter periplasmic adaptor subunit [Inhella proteolytica]MBH9577090.1 efflux RND transporter periplasmic adaptor subunit [Inhella proteolytica]
MNAPLNFPLNPLPAPQRRRRIALALSLALGTTLLGGFLAAYPGTAPQAMAQAAPQAMPVAVATVGAQTLQAWQGFSGRLEAVERVELRPRVAGTVHKVHFREGALVKAGDLLVSLDPAPYAVEVARQRAQLEASRARAAHAERETARAQTLWTERAIAQRELDDRLLARADAQAQVAAAQAALAAAQLNLDYTQLRAPVAGRIGKLEVTVGNQVAAGPGAPVLARLVSVSPIYASFDADERTVQQALAGAQRPEQVPVQMRSAAGEALTGRLQLVDNQVDAKSGTLRLRAVFDNADGRLTPGQFARLELGQAQQRTALLVNERAVLTDQDKRFVWVVGADDKVQWREVQLGGPANGLREVISGLKAGERIVLSGLQRVRPGSPVAPTVIAMDAKPELIGKTEAQAAPTKG